MRSVATIALLVVGVTASFAQSPVGTWTGKIELKMPKLPANMPPEQKAMMDKMLGQMKQARIVLTFKGDKTYTAESKGMPGPSGASTKSGGTWSQSGKTITMTAKEKPGQPTGAPKNQTMNFSADGKSLVLLIPNNQGQVTFTK